MLYVNKKQCMTCGNIYTLNNFPRYKNRKGKIAYLNECKKCKAIYKHKHYVDNKEDYLQRSKNQREKDPKAHKEYLATYYKENKERITLKNLEYAKTEKGKEVRKRCNHNYFSKDINKIKHNTRKRTLRAIKSGKLIKPLNCEICGLEKPLEAHHTDYSKYLEVQWLCKTCHENTHHLNEGH